MFTISQINDAVYKYSFLSCGELKGIACSWITGTADRLGLPFAYVNERTAMTKYICQDCVAERYLTNAPDFSSREGRTLRYEGHGSRLSPLSGVVPPERFLRGHLTFVKWPRTMNSMQKI